LLDYLKMEDFALCIPTFNAGNKWIEVLRSINEQELQPLKKFIIDSGSSDHTIQLAEQNGFIVNSISKFDFNHGKTRQQLADLARNFNLVVFLTQDAILASKDGIKNLIKVFDDETIGMAYGRQLPQKNAKPLEVHAREYNYPATPNKLSIADQKTIGFKAFFCSNSFSAYSVKALKAVNGFPQDSIMGEDAVVAAKMLKAGYKKAYVADATVFHSHSYTLVEEFKRYFDTSVFHQQNQWMIKEFGKPTGEGIKFVKSELSYAFKHSPRDLFKSAASIFAKWLGYKFGQFYKNMSISTVKMLSMHKFYWK